MHVKKIISTGLKTALAAAISLFPLYSVGAELRIGVSADITSLDPHHTNIAPNNNALWHMFEALTHVNADARLVPGLAESWRAVDGTTWEFKLRRSVKFHDGADFTADDVLASIERAKRMEASGGQFAGFVKPIKEAKVVDALTLRLTTEKPYAMLPYDLHSLFIISRKQTAAATEDFNNGKAANGTGPFKLASFKRGDRVEMARNDAYWGTKAPWDKASLRILPNDPARIAALVSGGVDMIDAIPTADAVKLKSNANFLLVQKVSWRTLFFHLDQYRDQPPGVTAKDGKPLGQNPFKDIRVRQAISKALNRQVIVERVMEGFALPASNLVSPPVFGYVKALVPDAFDAEGAKKLLAEAGFKDGFTVTVAAPNNRYVNDDQIALAAAQMLARIGLQVKVETHPAATYFTKARNGDFAFALLGWGSFSGDLALRALLATPDAAKGYGGWNWGRHSLPRLDQLLDQGFATTDEKKREAIAIEAATLALKNYGVIPLHHQIASWAMKSNLDYAARTDEFTFAQHVRPR